MLVGTGAGCSLTALFKTQIKHSNPISHNKMNIFKSNTAVLSLISSPILSDHIACTSI